VQYFHQYLFLDQREPRKYTEQKLFKTGNFTRVAALKRRLDPLIITTKPVDLTNDNGLLFINPVAQDGMYVYPGGFVMRMCCTAQSFKAIPPGSPEV
jgi:hypothetical protein